jgi:hypothetical protein
MHVAAFKNKQSCIAKKQGGGINRKVQLIDAGEKTGEKVDVCAKSEVFATSTLATVMYIEGCIPHMLMYAL